MSMRTTIFLLFSLFVIGFIVYAMWCRCLWPFASESVPSPTPTEEQSTTSDPTSDPTTDTAPAPATWPTYTTERVVGDRALVMHHPTSTTVSQVRPTIYEFKYVGPDSEPNTEITDGFYGSITIATGTSVAAYVAELDMVGDAAATTFQGMPAQAVTTESELSGQRVPHMVFASPEDPTVVVDISYVTMGSRAATYDQTVRQILESVSVVDASSDDTLWVALPQSGEVVDAPIRVAGRARGTWFFEGSFPVVVVDWDGRIIGEGYVTAHADWMTDTFVPFSGVVEYELPADIPYTRGTVILQKANPSGLPEHAAAREIPVELVPQQ